MPLSRFLVLLCLAAAVSVSGCVEIHGSGSGAVGAVFKDIIFQYKYTGPAVDASYVSSSSGRGLCRIKSPSTCSGDDSGGPLDVDFVASESVLTESDRLAYPDLQMYPMVAGAIVPVYNLPELDDGDGNAPATAKLQLSLSVLSRIYRCNITHWDDPGIRDLNPSIQYRLPNLPIQVLARAEDSGTTEIYKGYLALEDPLFKEEVGTGSMGGVEGWPCAQGNDNFNFRSSVVGVSSAVLATPYSLGYIPFGNAEELGARMVAVVKETGEIVQASQASITEALVALPLPQPANPASFEVRAPSAGWPLVGYTFFVIRTNAYGDRLRAGATCENVRETVRFMFWFFTAEVVKEFAILRGLTPLPDTVGSITLRHLLDNVMCGGTPAISLEDLQQGGLRFQLDAPGTVPVSLLKELRTLPLAYNIQSSTVEVQFQARAPVADCSLELEDWEWFRVETCGDRAAVESVDGRYTRVPFAVHPFQVVAHIPGASALQISMPIVSAIMQGQITRFNDPQLVELNPELETVDEAIALVDSLENPEIREKLGAPLAAPNSCSAPAHMCMTSNEAAALAVWELDFSMAVVPISALHSDFDKLVATFITESGAMVQPEAESMQACVEEGTAHACYPLSLISTVTLRSDYTDTQPQIATEAVKFWAWAIRNPEIAMQVEEVSSRWHIYHFGPEHRQRIDALLNSVTVNGTPVLLIEAPSQEKGSSLVVIVSAVAVGVLVALVALSGLMAWRVRKLCGKVKELEKETVEKSGRSERGVIPGDRNLEWDKDTAELPINKTLKFLEKMEAEGKLGVRKEASELRRIMKTFDPDLPTALSALAAKEKHIPAMVKYTLGLSTGSKWQSLRDGLKSSPSGFLAQVKQLELGTTADPNYTVSEQFRWWEYGSAAKEVASVAGMEDLNLNSVGKSFFCNVLHLQDYGVEQPLAFTTFAILQRNGLLEGLHLNVSNLRRYLAYVEGTYNGNPYHNNWHGADVTQRCAAILDAMQLPDNKDTRVHRLAAILAAAIHDAGHPGVDNNFMIKQEDQMAIDFNDQHVLEMHSLQVALHAICHKPGLNFLEGSRLDGKGNWIKFKHIVTSIVLATDMGQHFDLLAKFSAKFVGRHSKHEDQREAVGANLVLVLQVAMKAADLGHCASRWATHKYWSKGLEEEFFAQGDREREAGMWPLSPLMNRESTGCMEPSSQVGFFDFIVMPLYTALARAFPGTLLLATQAGANYRRWKSFHLQGKAAEDGLTRTMYLKRMSNARRPHSLVDMDDDEATKAADQATTKRQQNTSRGVSSIVIDSPSKEMPSPLLRSHSDRRSMQEITESKRGNPAHSAFNVKELVSVNKRGTPFRSGSDVQLLLGSKRSTLNEE